MLPESFYGREESELCMSEVSDVNIECQGEFKVPTADYVISEHTCEGKRHCDFRVEMTKIKTALGIEHDEPCPDASSYMEVHYQCVDD